jgi:hypothetical protein
MTIADYSMCLVGTFFGGFLATLLSILVVETFIGPLSFWGNIGVGVPCGVSVSVLVGCTIEGMIKRRERKPVNAMPPTACIRQPQCGKPL